MKRCGQSNDEEEEVSATVKEEGSFTTDGFYYGTPVTVKFECEKGSERAKVLEIYDPKTMKKYSFAVSTTENNLVFVVGNFFYCKRLNK
jgi:hypothetical protein